MKIFPKLVLSFLCISFIPLLLSALYSQANIKNSIKNSVLEELNVVNRLQVKELSYFFEKKESQVKDAGRSKIVNEFVLKSLFPNFKQELKLANLQDFLKGISDFVECDNILIHSTSGALLHSFADSDYLLKSERILENIRVVNSVLTPCSSVTKFTNKSIKKYFLVSGPIISSDHGYIGVLTFVFPEVKIFNVLKPFVNKRSTVETVIGSRVNDQLKMMTIQAYSPGESFNFEVDLDSGKALPMQSATLGKEEKGASIDYKSTKIFASWSFFPFMGWGIVSKIDIKEAYIPLFLMYKYYALIGGVFFLVIISFAVAISNNISQRIKLLQSSLKKIATGDFSHRVNCSGSDELASLYTHFNDMITKLDEYSKNLKDEIAEKEQAQQQKNEYISKISHELRSPLLPIKEGVNILKENSLGPTNENQNEMLDVIYRNADRLHVLVNDVLDFQKMGMGKLEYKFTEENINSLISKVIETFGVTSNQVQFRTNLSNDLPGIFIDKIRITQLLHNILGNALKFTKEGYVEIVTRKDNDKILIEIKDTGCGIHHEDIPKLFHSFCQINETSSERKKGSGLGLAICKEIIDAHKGNIWINSEFGKGTTVSFTLPINKSGKQ